MKKWGHSFMCIWFCVGYSLTANAQPDNGPDAQLVQMTQEADIIVKARVVNVEQSEEGIKFKMGFPTLSFDGILKGRKWLSKGFLIPNGRANPFEARKVAIVFGRYDPVRKINIVLNGDKARREPTEDNMELIERLLQEQPRAQISMQAVKPAYRMDETVEVRWKVKNTSSQAFRLFTGKDAVGANIIINGNAGGPAVRKTSERHQEDYMLLAPGQEWTQTMPLPRDYFEGTAVVHMELDNPDNYIGKNAKTFEARQEDALFVHEEARFELTIMPPDDATMALLTSRLGSPYWDVQWNALNFLARTVKGRALPQVSALLSHPWRKIRLRAAYALAWKSETFDAALRELLFNPDVEIRTQTIEIMRNRYIQGAGLSLLALKIAQENAIDNGFVFSSEEGGNPVDKLKSRYNDNYDITLQRTNDPRIGDILATWLKEGRDNGYELMFLVDLQSKLRLSSQNVPSEEQKKELLDGWEAKRGEVAGIYTIADLEAEIKEASQKIYGEKPRRYDDPQFLTIRDLLVKDSKNKEHEKFDEQLKELQALGAASAPQLLEFFQLPGNTGYGYLSLPLHQALLDWKTNAVFDEWLGRAYDGDAYLPWFLASLDGKRAQPHLLHLFEAPPQKFKNNNGAALGLLKLGDKRAIPAVFAVFDRYDSSWQKRAIDALKPLTGQNFDLPHEWVKWWKAEGSKQEWK